MIEIELLAAIVPLLLVARFMLVADSSAQVRGAIFVLICVVAIVGRHMNPSIDLAMVLVAIVLCGSVILTSMQKGHGVDDE